VLGGKIFGSVTFSGSGDTVGVNDETFATNLAGAICSQMDFHCTVGTNTWYYCASRFNSSGELWINAPSLCDINSCPNPGYILRPCNTVGGGSYGGAANQNTCNNTMTTSVVLTFCSVLKEKKSKNGLFA